MQMYRKALADCANNGYKGFKPFLPESEATTQAAPQVARPAEDSV